MEAVGGAVKRRSSGKDMDSRSCVVVEVCCPCTEGSSMGKMYHLWAKGAPSMLSHKRYVRSTLG